MTLQGTTVLFFAGPLYEDLELWYPKIRLEEEGARTVVAGTGEQTYQGKRGYPLTVDANVDDLEADDFDGLVIPGGYAPDIMRRSKKLLQLTRRDLRGRTSRWRSSATRAGCRSRPESSAASAAPASARSRTTW